MVTTKLNLSMTEPQVRQIYAKQGDTGRVLDITLDQTPEDGTLRILRPDGTEVTSEAVTGGEVESGSTFESLTEADVTELTAGIEPVQDLNGYDKPWVGGAGVNKADWANNSSGIGTGITKTATGFDMSSMSSGQVPQVPMLLFPWSDADTAITVSFYAWATEASAMLRFDGQPDSVYPTGTGFMDKAIPLTTTRTRYSYSGAIVSGTTGFRWFRLNSDTGATTATIHVENIQLEFGSTATSFEPYSNICPITGHDEVTVNFGAEQGTADETYTTSLGQTVYGGTLDMASGVLTVDSRYLTVDDFTFMPSGTSAGGLHWVNVPTSYPKGVNDDTSTNVCSHAPYTSSGDVGWGSTTPMYSVNSGGFPARVYVASASLADFKTEYATLQAVYKLATPVEYQLTPQQIKTLVGTNNVWASSGDIVNITFTYGGLLSEIPSQATEIVGKCYCDVEQNGVSSMPFTLNVKKNERQ